jgi:hypothetical protein
MSVGRADTFAVVIHTDVLRPESLCIFSASLASLFVQRACQSFPTLCRVTDRPRVAKRGQEKAYLLHFRDTAATKYNHERHTRELSVVVRELGGTLKADMKSVLTKGKVVIGNITGDSGILQAM